MPSLQSSAGTRREDTLWSCARAQCSLYVCALRAIPLCVCARVRRPLIFCDALYEACAVLFKENYIVLFMEGDSINRGALMLGEELHR